MKKTVFIAALAVVAMASCTKNELKVPATGTDAVISFQPVVANATKATYLETANMKDKCASFGVFAWYAEPSLAAGGSATAYMDNVTVTYDGDIDETGSTGSGAWAPTSPYYWPKNGTLSFDAYAPAHAHADTPGVGTGKVTSTAANGLKIENYTVAALANQYDLLYSTRTLNKTTSTGGGNNTYDGVDIAFKHALAAIEVTAKTDADYGTDAIKLNKVSILYACNQGNFSQRMTNPVSNEDPVWTNQRHEVEYVLYDAGATLSNGASLSTSALTSLTTPAIKNAILLPQSFEHASNTVSIKVDYSIKHGSSYLPQTQTFKLNTTTVNDNNGNPVNQSEWEMGKKYTYNFIFSLEEIYFAPSVENWTEVTVNDITVK